MLPCRRLVAVSFSYCDSRIFDPESGAPGGGGNCACSPAPLPRRTGHPPPRQGEATLVRLSCVDDDAQGQSLDVLWENELDAELRNAENWSRIADRGFDPAPRFAAYAVHQGKRIFEDLALRMEQKTSLQVRLFLNLTVRPEDTSSLASVKRFAQEFKTRHWPENHRLPEVYYDRRSLDAPMGPSVAFHAKCVVLDEAELFVSTANFTEAAQNRNVELGVLLRSTTLAKQATSFLAELISDHICERAV